MYARLYITDGTTTIDLVHDAGELGFHLKQWRPAVAEPKGGGTWHDSPMGDGRRLAQRVWGNAYESLTLDVNGRTQNDAIGYTQNLRRLLEKARDFWINPRQAGGPVWIGALASSESNARYAYVYDGRTPEDDDPYGPGFSATPLPMMVDWPLTIERGHWMSVAPGGLDCLTVSAIEAWQYPVWDLRATFATNDMSDLIEDNAGGLYCSNTTGGNIYKSADGGVTWALNSAVPINGGRMFRAANGYLYCSDTGQVLRSVNNGGLWVATAIAGAGGTLSPVVQDRNGRLWTANQPNIYSSIDNGANWVLLATPPPLLAASTFYILPDTNGDLFIKDNFRVYRSSNNGATWVLARTQTGIPYISKTGRIFIADGTQLLSSDDHLATVKLCITMAWLVSDIYQRQSDGAWILINANGDIYRSNDDGTSWYLQTAIAAMSPFAFGCMLSEADSALACGGDGAGNGLIYRALETAINMGFSAACSDVVMVSNKSSLANLNQLMYYDTSVPSYTSLYPLTAWPTSLYPAVPGVGDILYFGISTAALNQYGPFSNVVLNLKVGFSAGTPTLVWEYWNGAWVALTVTLVNNLQTSGENTVVFSQPANWATVAVNGVTGLWIRCRITVVAAGLPPQQLAGQVYSAVLPYIDIPASSITGDIPALLRVKFRNYSDKDGTGGAAPNLWDNRVLVARRTLERGPGFNAYINISDLGNDLRLTLAIPAGVAYSADPSRVTGRLTTWTAAIGDTTFADRATVSFSSTIARDYYGAFRVFLRARVTAGASGDITFRVQARSGAGGMIVSSGEAYLRSTTDYELLDLGKLALPPNQVLSNTDLADSLLLSIQGKNSSGAARTVYLHDLILMPVDEVALDSIDLANTTGSIIGFQTPPRYLDLDSASDPLYPIKALIRSVTTEDQIVSSYFIIGAGPLTAEARVDQRIWFLAARTSATGATYVLLSEPWMMHSVQVQGINRYLSMRGDE